LRVERAHRFLALDGLRGLCALSVVLHHADKLFLPVNLVPRGYLAVDIFFMMSGFVLSLAYEERLRTGLDPLHFLRVRIKRLAPVYWVGATIATAGLAVAWLDGEISIRQAMLLSAAGYILLPVAGGPFPDAFNINGPAWSLWAEVIVNALYGFAARWLTNRRLVLIIAVGFAAAILHGLQSGSMNYGHAPLDLRFGLLRAIPAFAVGILICRLRQSPHFQRLPDVNPLPVVGIWLLLEALPASSNPLGDFSIVVVAATAVVALLVRTTKASPAWFGPLGAMSYALYACHYPILEVAKKTTVFGFENGPDPLRAAVLMLCVLAVAWCTHVAVERRRVTLAHA
jgi:peptidoglycan/LPS O-acetylase OafA/YrhL